MMMSATRSVSPTTSSMLRIRKTTPKANNNNIRKPTKQRSTNAMATFTSPSSRRSSSWSIARSSARCGVQTKTTLTTTTMMKKNESNNKTVKEQQQQQQRRNATITKANEDDSSSSSSSVDASSDDPFEFGSKSKKRRRRDGKSTRRATVAVDSPAIAAAKGESERTVVEESEEAFLKFLGFYIAIIFAFGVVLALSAFKIWPDSVDSFITDTLYPAFTPFVGGFLVFSSIYGLIKTRSDPTSKSG
jgi:hypothetical protein